MLTESNRTFLYRVLMIVLLTSLWMLVISPIVLYANVQDEAMRRMSSYRFPASAMGGGAYYDHETRPIHISSIDRIHHIPNTRANLYPYSFGPYYYDSYIRPYDRFESYRKLSDDQADRMETQSESVEQQKMEPAKTIYTIQKGDTLYRIAKFFGTTADLLMVENNISDPTKLQIGQQIYVPSEDQDMKDWVEENDRITNVFHATLTAYTAGFESTGKTPSHPQYGITASGAKVKDNHTIAVDPNVIPLGTLVYIEGLGIRKAEDTGSAIKGNKIDVYIPDLDEAIAFGVKKNVKVYVLDSKNKNEVQIASNRP